MIKVGDKVRRIGFDNSCTDKGGKLWLMPPGSLWVVEACSPRGWLTLAGFPFPNGSDSRYFELVEKAPTSRSTDPATSKGKRKVNKYEQAVLDYLKKHGEEGGTGKSIASETFMPLNCITPRFAPLRRKGLIKDSGIKHDKQIVWVLA